MSNVNVNPEIRTYHFNAFAESIMAVHKDYNAWKANNYIQIMAYEDFYNGKAVMEYLVGSVFGGCELLDYQDFSDEKECFIKSIESMNRFFEDSFQQNASVYTFADEYYVASTSSYQKEHFVHDILICGKQEGKYEYLGYDSIGNYSKNLISEEILFKALHVDNKCVRSIKCNTKSYKFDLNKFILMLEEYLYGKDSRNNLNIYIYKETYNEDFYGGKLKRPCVFGTDIYMLLKKIMSIMASKDLGYDKRILYLLSEHKQSMMQKIIYVTDENYLENGKYFQEKYNDICKKAKILENIGLRYGFTKDTNELKKIEEKLFELKEGEETILKELLEQLHKKDR